MARTMNRLTVKRATTATRAGLHADGGGLYLCVKASGSRSWLFIYQWRGRRREKGLGPLRLVTLEEARAKRDEASKLLAQGVDPLDNPNGKEAVTFGKVATDLISDLEIGWKNPKHRQQWRNTLQTYCTPVWDRCVNLVDANDIIEILKPIWLEKPETASRVRARIERVLDAAKVQGLRSGENPARWSGHLQLVLPGNTRSSGVRHHPAMPFAQVPDFVHGLKLRISTAARALEFLIHTAGRTSEVIHARWAEMDLEEATWTLPAERMKAGREHIVPLTEPALVVLRSMAVFGTDPSAFVFPSRLEKKPLSNMAMDMLLRRMGCDDYTVHGFRSSFRDWAGEETNFAREIVELALAHQVGSAVERAYRRGTAVAKRRELMEAWSRFVTNAASRTAASPSSSMIEPHGGPSKELSGVTSESTEAIPAPH